MTNAKKKNAYHIFIPIQGLVQFSCSVMSDSLQPHGSQYTGFSVHYKLLELAKTHVHWVSDAIQPSHHLLSPSPPTFKLSQHQGLFQWVNSSYQVAKVLKFQLQHQSFQWIFRTEFRDTRSIMKVFQHHYKHQLGLPWWIRICLPMQGAHVQSLVWEDSIHCGATEPMPCNYWAYML